MRVLSGIQPSGSLHLGNYFGMMSKMIAYQEESELFCFIANYHALTTNEDPDALREAMIAMMKPVMPLLFPRLMPGMMPKVMPAMLAAVNQRIDMPQEMVDKANEQMDNFCKMMEDRGIIVDRVTVHPYLEGVNSYGTPDWTQLNGRGINNPRDLFLPVGNEIMEAPGTLRSRWY